MKTEMATLASQYAQAVMDLSIKSGASVEESVLTDLAAVNKVVSDVPDFAVVLKHPSIPSSDKKALLLKLFQGKVGELTLRLLNLLADKRRLSLLPYIESEYRELLKSRKSILSASLVSAEPLSDATVSQIKTKLAKQLGKTLELDVKVDKSLIAGVVLRIGDQVVDGSLKGKLQVLERSLLSV